MFIHTCLSFDVRPEYIFLSTDRLSGRSDVTSDKVNFRPDIRKKNL